MVDRRRRFSPWSSALRARPSARRDFLVEIDHNDDVDGDQHHCDDSNDDGLSCQLERHGQHRGRRDADGRLSEQSAQQSVQSRR